MERKIKFREGYRTWEWSKAGKDFREVFKINIEPFFDGLMTVVFRKIKIDAFLFDDYLHRVYGEYEDRGLSMEDVVRENYGEEGIKLLKKLL
jgi:hypothetical protein